MWTWRLGCRRDTEAPAQCRSSYLRLTEIQVKHNFFQIVMHNMLYSSRIVYECGIFNQKTPIAIHQEPRTTNKSYVMIRVKNMRIERSKPDRPCLNIIALIYPVGVFRFDSIYYTTHTDVTCIIY